MPILFVLILLAAGALPSAGTPASALKVTFRTEDGMALAGTLYEPSRRPAPAVLFLHMLTRNRGDWEAVAARLAEDGIAGLTVDLRGHGESGPPGATPGGLNVSSMLADVRAALRFLQGRGDVIPGRIGIAGASLGANLAILRAADDPAVRSIALLSASLDYRGLRVEAAMRKYAERPALIVASSDDPYATRSAHQLATFGTGVRELQLLDGAGHGTIMLARSPDLARTLVDWFNRTLL